MANKKLVTTSTRKAVSTAPARKSPEKKAVPTRTRVAAARTKETMSEPVHETPVTTNETARTTKTRSALNVKRSYMVTAGVIFVLLALLYFTRSWFVAATVNGQPISRLAVIKELEKSGGANALNTLVTKTLIGQEARKKHVSVSNAEVDTEVKNIEKRLSGQGQKLTDALTSANMSMNDLRDQVRYQKLLEKMVGPVTVSDTEVADYMEKNKASLPQGTDASTLKAQIKESLRQQKLNDKIQPFVQNLQSQARVSKWVSY
jgi:foldase protein PrsA